MIKLRTIKLLFVSFSLLLSSLSTPTFAMDNSNTATMVSSMADHDCHDKSMDDQSSGEKNDEPCKDCDKGCLMPQNCQSQIAIIPAFFRGLNSQAPSPAVMQEARSFKSQISHLNLPPPKG